MGRDGRSKPRPESDQCRKASEPQEEKITTEKSAKCRGSPGGEQRKDSPSTQRKIRGTGKTPQRKKKRTLVGDENKIPRLESHSFPERGGVENV